MRAPTQTTRPVYLDGLEAERFLIESNRQREKTKVQRLREYKRLKEIEGALAKDREKAGKKITRNPSANLRDGRSDERAAKVVGLKPRTAEKGLAVLNKADAGDVKAKEALQKLDRNEVSVDRAYREVSGKEFAILKVWLPGTRCTETTVRV